MSGEELALNALKDAQRTLGYLKHALNDGVISEDEYNNLTVTGRDLDRDMNPTDEVEDRERIEEYLMELRHILRAVGFYIGSKEVKV